MEGKMKIRSLAFVISVLFVVGLSGNVLAVNDSTGENLIPGVDIASSSVQTSNIEGDNTVPTTANLGISMAAGSNLPGAVIWDIDVDNDTATGGGSMVTGIPSILCGGAPCKADAGGGFDFFVVLILRNQSDTSTLADCNNCVGSDATCVTRGTPDATCNEGTCYGLGDPCQIGDPDCYEQTAQCTGCDTTFKYPLDVVCGNSARDCAAGYIKGQYYVGFGQGQNNFYQGNISLALDYNMSNETEICLEIPWALIAVQAFANIQEAGGTPFPIGSLSANLFPRFQVSAFIDEDFADQDDLFTRGPFTLDVSDWMPDTARAADGEYNQHPPCGHNTAGGYGDVNVDANDVGNFLAEFGRSVFSRPCPNCK